jgi:hypothetical protein
MSTFERINMAAKRAPQDDPSEQTDTSPATEFDNVRSEVSQAVTNTPEHSSDSTAGKSAEEIAMEAEARALDEDVTAATVGATELGLQPATKSNVVKTDEFSDVAKRPRLTPAQRALRNREYLKRGKELLELPAQGMAFVTVETTIKHRQLHDLFLRAYPMIDMSIATLNRSGAIFLGKRDYDAIFGVLDARVAELKRVAAGSHDMARALINQAKSDTVGLDPDSVELQYNAALNKVSVTARSPQSVLLLRTFKEMDTALSELDQVVWSGHRTANDVSGEFVNMKRVVNTIASLMVRTLQDMQRKSRAVYAKKQEAAEPSSEPIE